ncbi:MAG: ATPase domain-containing protein [Thermodesulfobacteriota bacterium]
MDAGHERLIGIPAGNTVALVGDPGTGKTTFLLSFFCHGRIREYGPESDAGPPGARSIVLCSTLPPGDRFNRLFLGSSASKLGGKNHKPLLRCFVSLESSYQRVRAHTHLLPVRNGTATEDADAFWFVDATAFLSGRLEDYLRYLPAAPSETPEWEQQESKDDTAGWRHYRLSLGGFGTEDNPSFGLYWQGGEGKRPERIESLSVDGGGGDHPFAGNHPTVLTLLTQTIQSPEQRIRLLKDLLAELFRRFPGHDCILAIDSLSALLSAPGQDAAGQDDLPIRRLHMLNLVRWLEERGATTFMACEAVRPDDTLGGRPLFLGTQERYVASGVIQLNYHRYRSGDMIRYLRVLKMRGCGHDMRPYAYELGPEGITWLELLFGEPMSGEGV